MFWIFIFISHIFEKSTYEWKTIEKKDQNNFEIPQKWWFKYQEHCWRDVLSFGILVFTDIGQKFPTEVQLGLEWNVKATPCDSLNFDNR